MQKLAAGNWKMNGTSDDLDEVLSLIAAHPAPKTCEMVICPPATLLSRMAEKAAGSALQVGGQDCHAKSSGAHTGDISAEMLRDAGANWVILGHSERRQDHQETDVMIRAKMQTAHEHNLAVILCVGESRQDRMMGRTLDVVGRQLGAVLRGYQGSESDAWCTQENFAIAYEPIWAIGTGQTPTMAEIAEVHAFIRDKISEDAYPSMLRDTGRVIRLLYGGSVKPSNAAEIFALPHVNGALVGGASLRASDFGAIVAALDAA
ncbi:MAG: triose-phosphate isomerase [Pseudorhodobacter sp.]